MKKKHVPIPKKYYKEIFYKVDWPEILFKLGIRFRRTKKGIGIYEARCIFHKEKTPSLIFTSQGWFHCFGCGYSGDMFDLVRYHLFGGDRVKTCRWLKKCFDIDLPWEN